MSPILSSTCCIIVSNASFCFLLRFSIVAPHELAIEHLCVFVGSLKLSHVGAGKPNLYRVLLLISMHSSSSKISASLKIISENGISILGFALRVYPNMSSLELSLCFFHRFKWRMIANKDRIWHSFHQSQYTDANYSQALRRSNCTVKIKKCLHDNKRVVFRLIN